MNGFQIYLAVTVPLVAVASFIMTRRGSDFPDLLGIGVFLLFWPAALVGAVILSPVWIPYLIAKHL